MVLRVGEVMHEAPHAAAPAETGPGSGGGQVSSAALQSQVVAALRRERSRHERLWAD
jgi:hypothetical protein